MPAPTTSARACSSSMAGKHYPRETRREQEERAHGFRPRDDLHDGGHAGEVRRRRLRTTPAGSSSGSASSARCSSPIPGVAALGHPERIKGLIEAEGIEVVLYDRARVEPTIDSFQDAADFALEHEVDGFVSVGGGSSIDTAKVANLVSHPPGAGDGLRQPAGRRGQEAAVAAQAAPGDPDHVGHRLGGDDRRRARHPGHEAQDRASRTATCARRRRSSTRS